MNVVLLELSTCTGSLRNLSIWQDRSSVLVEGLSALIAANPLLWSVLIRDPFTSVREIFGVELSEEPWMDFETRIPELCSGLYPTLPSFDCFTVAPSMSLIEHALQRRYQTAHSRALRESFLPLCRGQGICLSRAAYG